MKTTDYISFETIKMIYNMPWVQVGSEQRYNNNALVYNDKIYQPLMVFLREHCGIQEFELSLTDKEARLYFGNKLNSMQAYSLMASSIFYELQADGDDLVLVLKKKENK